VTQKIVSAMAVKLTVDERRRLEHKSTDNLAAYDHFLRGIEQYRLQTKDNISEVKAIFEQAAKLDPHFAPAYAFLSFIHLMDHINRWNVTGARPLERAHELAERAIALDDTYPQAHVALGSVYLWQKRHDAAVAEFERAIALDPNFATGHVRLGWVLHYAGRAEEVIGLIQRGVRLDPHYPDDYLHMLAQAHFQLARYEHTVDLLGRRLVLKPDSDISRVLLAASYGHLGRAAAAQAEWVQVQRINPAYSLEHSRQVMPYKDAADFEKIVAGLRRAGLPP
jgi:tetratricopeptide (TPR) repeat protein